MKRHKMYVGDGGGVYSMCGIACTDEDSPYFLLDWGSVTCARCKKVLTNAMKKVEKNKLKLGTAEVRKR